MWNTLSLSDFPWPVQNWKGPWRGKQREQPRDEHPPGYLVPWHVALASSVSTSAWSTWKWESIAVDLPYLLWPQCDGLAGFANRISVFALLPGIIAGGWHSASDHHAHRCCSQQKEPVSALPAPASCCFHLFQRWMRSLYMIIPKTPGLRKAGWRRDTTVFPYKMAAQEVHSQGLRGTRK